MELDTHKYEVYKTRLPLFIEWLKKHSDDYDFYKEKVDKAHYMITVTNKHSFDQYKVLSAFYNDNIKI